jgi:enoyl-CoA hydratase/carnithine racemase
LYFTGLPMSATELRDAGGCIFVAAPGQHLAEARRLAMRVASYSPTAVRVSKRVLDRIEWMSLEDGYAFEQAASVRMSGHPDSKEALAAFHDKREPGYLAEVDRAMFD